MTEPFTKHQLNELWNKFRQTFKIDITKLESKRDVTKQVKKHTHSIESKKALNLLKNKQFSKLIVNEIHQVSGKAKPKSIPVRASKSGKYKGYQRQAPLYWHEEEVKVMKTLKRKGIKDQEIVLAFRYASKRSPTSIKAKLQRIK